MSVFNVFFTLIAQALALVYAIHANYAFAIVGLTLIIMVVLTPLTLKGTRSMMVMQQLQPEMKKIQTRYKDDRQKLNEELLKFYKENDISPLGGCLPLLVQMPVFIVLYQVLRGLTRRVSSMGFDFGWVSGQLGSGVGPTKPPAISPAQNFDPAYLNHNSKMYQSLSQTNVMQAWGMDLSESASKALQHGIVHAIPYVALIVIVAVTSFVQQRQIQGRTANQQTNPQQQMIMKVMPIFLPVISFGLPAGLVIYFAVSNLYRVGQQWFISRSIYGMKGGEAPPAAAVEAGTKPASPGGGFLATLRQAAGGSPATSSDKPAATKAKAGSSTSKSAKASSSRSTARKPTPAKPGRAQPSKASSKAQASAKPTKAGADTTSAAPAPAPGGAGLQPRARKNKKR
jgi:YidC/Oxa1 family membrane protein insertase